MLQSKHKRPVRISVHERAEVTDVQGNSFSATVSDISAKGLCLESSERLVPGEQIRLRIGDYEEFEAQVRWAHAHRAGLSFAGSGPKLNSNQV